MILSFNGQDPNSMTFSWFVDSTLLDNGIDFTYPFDAIIGDSINYLVTLEAQTVHGCREGMILLLQFIQILLL